MLRQIVMSLGPIFGLMVLALASLLMLSIFVLSVYALIRAERSKNYRESLLAAIQIMVTLVAIAEADARCEDTVRLRNEYARQREEYRKLTQK